MLVLQTDIKYNRASNWPHSNLKLAATLDWNQTLLNGAASWRETRAQFSGGPEHTVDGSPGVSRNGGWNSCLSVWWTSRQQLKCLVVNCPTCRVRHVVALQAPLSVCVSPTTLSNLFHLSFFFFIPQVSQGSTTQTLKGLSTTGETHFVDMKCQTLLNHLVSLCLCCAQGLHRCPLLYPFRHCPVGILRRGYPGWEPSSLNRKQHTWLIETFLSLFFLSFLIFVINAKIEHTLSFQLVAPALKMPVLLLH